MRRRAGEGREESRTSDREEASELEDVSGIFSHEAAWGLTLFSVDGMTQLPELHGSFGVQKRTARDDNAGGLINLLLSRLVI
jgi:hypothetical protein